MPLQHWAPCTLPFFLCWTNSGHKTGPGQQLPVCCRGGRSRPPWSARRLRKRLVGVAGAQEAGAGAGSWAPLREGPSASPSRLLTVMFKCSSLFSLDEVGILMILIILKGQQRSFESPSVLARNQLINWKPFRASSSAVGVWCEVSSWFPPCARCSQGLRNGAWAPPWPTPAWFRTLWRCGLISFLLCECGQCL